MSKQENEMCVFTATNSPHSGQFSLSFFSSLFVFHCLSSGIYASFYFFSLSFFNTSSNFFFFASFSLVCSFISSFLLRC